MAILASQFDSVGAAAGDWQQQMKWAIRDVETLMDRLKLSADPRVGARATRQFPVFVPLPFMARMELGNLDDPLLRQVLPRIDEDQSPSRFSKDPIGEATATLKPGLLQKYAGRVLLVTTGACAVHCRYCFRRHFPYHDAPHSANQWGPALEQIAGDEGIEEVILSGGDPLTLVDGTLGRLVESLSGIKHLKRLRVHTRLPIMIPQRVTASLVELLTRGPLQPIVVIHSNHARELGDDVELAIKKLVDANIMLLNQAVLLRGVNDSANALIDLSRRLLDCRVMPYYLHQLDPVEGAAHFEVGRERGVELIGQMRNKLPGYAVPRYVKEIEGEFGKTVWA